MSDAAQRVDPATREAIAKIAREVEVSTERLAAAFRHVGLTLTVPEPEPEVALPPEPQDGFYRDREDPVMVWVRDSKHDAHLDTPDGSFWWSYRDEWWFSWPEAFEHGVDPARRLVELPDPDDISAMTRLAARARWHAQTTTDAKCIEDEAWVVCALSEQGAPE